MMPVSNIQLTSRSLLRGGWVLLWFFATALGAGAAGLQDNFAARETITTESGTLTANNAAATTENGEPKHGGKRGGRSLWITWVAPANGVATFDTHGSSFDTLISAYTLNPADATTLDKLHEEARNDDDPGSEPASLMQFGAIAGQSYQIAVDGYDGASGSLVLTWSLAPSASPPPLIISTPNSQAARQGDQVTLTVALVTSEDLNLAWFFNGRELAGQSGASLTVNNLQATNVGRYQLRITVGSGNNRVRFFTAPAELQINSDGATNSLATDKLLDSATTPLIGDNGAAGGTFSGARVPPGTIVLAATDVPGVVRGYNGSQVFNTTFATTDPAEPPHAGVAAGASYWLMYQPPANGTMMLDTAGSSYDTVMEVYTFNGALGSYADLISVAADNDGVSLNGPSRVALQVVKTRLYLIVVAGVNGARGTAWLNYTLNINQPAQPPTLQGAVTTQTVTSGATVTLSPSIVGALPMGFSWRRGATPIGGTIPVLQLPGLTPAETGDYALTVTNDLGTLVVTVPVHVVEPPQCLLLPRAGGMDFAFSTVHSFLYTIERAPSVGGPWTSWGTPFAGNGEVFSTNVTGGGTGFFRVRIE